MSAKTGFDCQLIMSSPPDDPDRFHGESTETELLSFDTDKDQPFKDFSSISDKHTDIDTTLPHFYQSNPEEENELPLLTVSQHGIDVLDKDNINHSIPVDSLTIDSANTQNEIASDVDTDIDNVPSPADYRSFSFGNSDASPLLIRSIDQRFQTRLSSLTSVRSISSNISGASSFSSTTRGSDSDTPISRNTVFSFDDEHLLMEETSSNPWETVRWSKLRKISNQIFSTSAQTAYGKPTCILAAAHIVLGMSHGQVLVFDYHQTLQAVLGANTKAIECGEVTSLAVSADFSYIASGYSTGHIFTWDLAKPSYPNIHIRPLAKSALAKSKHSDGHVENTSVIYLNFVGKRHSALISGDVIGMAFSHDTKRSVVGRTVHSHRILGRYPQANSNTAQPKLKPTTLLACSPLPLGSVVQPTDKNCLVAILTPYLLAIVSVLPKPETEFKTGRPKTVTSEMGLSGCLAWLPALKSTSPGTPGTNTRLAYSWSNVVTVIELVTSKNGALSPTNKRSVSLDFKFVNRFVGNEAIVSIQWLSRQVIALVTSTQRLILLNEQSMTISATVDLLDKHISHTDLFSSTLRDLTLSIPGVREPQPVVVCDAFFNSIRGFKGKLFLLGNYELVVGSLSNWADRLLDTMQTGDYIGAIDLATSYYVGTQDLAIVSLPSNDEERHSIVIKNLPEMILASIKYTFNGTRTVSNKDQTWEEFLQELCDTCLQAWIAIGKPVSLLEEIFDQFEQNNYSLLFFESLTPLISNGQVIYLPPTVFRELVKTHVSDPTLANRLEEVICSLDIETLDLDTAITLSKEYHLRDVLIYIWDRALNDYITPLVEFIESISQLQTRFNRRSSIEDLMDTEKVYPYISYILSGRVYPTGLPFEDQKIAANARSYVYYFLFSSTNIAWPQKGGSVVLTRKNNKNDEDNEEPIYPYLTILLKFNPVAFFAALNEAFEDPFLNDGEDSKPHLENHARSYADDLNLSDSNDQIDEALIFGSTVNRQLIVNILLEVFMVNGIQENGYESSQRWRLGPNERIFLNIFVARNYPKYAQFIILPGSVLSNVIYEICNYSKSQGTIGDDKDNKNGNPLESYKLKEECELSLEALFSKYKPYDLDDIIQLLQEVQFYSVLQFVFRSECKYDELLRVKLQLWKEVDHQQKSVPESELSGTQLTVSGLFDVLAECFRNTSFSNNVDAHGDSDYLYSQSHAKSNHSNSLGNRQKEGLSETVCKKQRAEIVSIVTKNFKLFAKLNTVRLVRIIANYSPQLHENVFKFVGLPLDKLTNGGSTQDPQATTDEDENNDTQLQFKYLDSLFGLVAAKSGQYALPSQKFRHLYVRLLCQQVGVKSNNESKPISAKEVQVKLFKLFKTIMSGPEDVNLNVVRQSLESCGASDSIVLILRRQNKTVEALECVIGRLKALDNDGYNLAAAGETNDDKKLEDIHFEMNKYLELGIQICNHRDSTLKKKPDALGYPQVSENFDSSKINNTLSKLDCKLGLQTMAEKLWVMLIDSIVEIAKKSKDTDVAKSNKSEITHTSKQTHDIKKNVLGLFEQRDKNNSEDKHSIYMSNLLQQALFSLLDKSKSTSSNSIISSKDDSFDNATIVRICSALLTPINFEDADQDEGGNTNDTKSANNETIVLKIKKRKNRTIGAVRPLLNDLFSAYRYQTRVLEVSKRVLDKDAFEALCELNDIRVRGWRVALAGSHGVYYNSTTASSNTSPNNISNSGVNGNGGECEGCGKTIAGLGVDVDQVYKLWEDRMKQRFGDSVLKEMTVNRNSDAIDNSNIIKYNGNGIVAKSNRYKHNQAEKLSRMVAKGKLSVDEINLLIGKETTSKLFGTDPNGNSNASVLLNEIVKGQQKNEDGRILVVFKCGHVYHLKCLRNLGVRGELKCIIDDI